MTAISIALAIVALVHLAIAAEPFFRKTPWRDT